MTVSDAKRKLLDVKRSHCLKETINKSDLMLLINIAWNILHGISNFLVLIKIKKILLIEDGDYIIAIFLPCLISERQ